MILWALLTGIVTGGAWVAIVLFQRVNRLSRPDPELLADLQHRLDQLEQVEQRLAQVEERLDFAERMLVERREAGRLPPSGRA
jgi:hypothetical protein